MAYNGECDAAAASRPASQTFEILARQRSPAQRESYVHGRPLSMPPTTLNNPTFNGYARRRQPRCPGLRIWPSCSRTTVRPANNEFPFILDGRWLSAFNGPGMGASTTCRSMELTSPCRTRRMAISVITVWSTRQSTRARRHGRRLRRLRPGELVPGDPERRRPGDDPLVPPAGDHPVRPEQPQYSRQRLVTTQLQNGSGERSTRLGSRILRPVAADGHDAATFPDLVPDPTTGKITYDVDNDGDGVTDSVWLDLGYPARRDAQRPALQAAVRLHGHRPERPDPAQHRRQPRRRLARPTPSTWATRSARSTRPTPSERIHGVASVGDSERCRP